MTAPASTMSGARRARFSLSGLQVLGRALMLPIAVLPVAGLLLRLGNGDIPHTEAVAPMMAAAGGAIFSNLGLLFAIGVAVGFAKDGNGAAGLAGVVCFLVAAKGAQSLMVVPPETLAGIPDKAKDAVVAAFKDGATGKLQVPLGILSGLIGGTFYNRFGAIKLPEYLAFFGGRRFVPIISGLAGVVLALVFGLGWSSLDKGVDGLSHAIVEAGPLGLFAFGVLNRLLIVTGLHHILNNVAWFIVGDFHGATGDLNRFFKGDPTAGAFMSGFFPVMMFGLPAACLAMYHTALPERRKAVGGMLFSLALTAILTGVTEPIEFSFMFLAPALYAIHAMLTGVSMVVMDLLGVRLGFGFSAGLFDYLLNFTKATRPLLLVPVGLVYFGLYYGLFRFFIQRFDLKTPGREPEAAVVPAAATASPGARARGFVDALGGAGNLVSIDACTTRLRLVVADQGAVNEPALKALGARGVIRPSPRDIQVVIGPTADNLAREMRETLGAPAPAAAPSTMAEVTAPATASVPPDTALAGALLEALGGADNLREVFASCSRLSLHVADDAKVDEPALRALASRGLARPKPGALHVLLGPDAEPALAGLKTLSAALA